MTIMPSTEIQYPLLANAPPHQLFHDANTLYECQSQEGRQLNEQLQSHNGRRVKRKAASLDLNCSARRTSTTPEPCLHHSVKRKISREASNSKGFTKSEPQLQLNHTARSTHANGFILGEPLRLKHQKAINQLPRVTSDLSNIYASSFGPSRYRPSYPEISNANLTELSTISLSKFPQPPRVDNQHKLCCSSTSSETANDKQLLSFKSTALMQFADGTFDLLNPHKSLCDTTFEHPAEEQDSSLSSSCSAKFKNDSSEHVMEAGSTSREGSIRPRPLYNDLSSAYQSITSRTTDAYRPELGPKIPARLQTPNVPSFKRFSSASRRKTYIAEGNNLNEKNKRASSPQFLQRVARAFSLRKNTSDDTSPRRHSEFREQSQRYLSGLFSNRVLSMEDLQSPNNFRQNVSVDDIDIEIGRRRPVLASSHSLFDWTDEESNYLPSVYFRNSISHGGTSSQGTNIRSAGNNSYSFEFGSNPYMYRASTDGLVDDTISFSDNIGPRIDSTIGSILNRYDHTRESYQAVSSAISLHRSSLSFTANHEDGCVTSDGKPNTESVVSYIRPTSKMLPPPLLLRADPAYAGTPPNFPAPAPDGETDVNGSTSRLDNSIPSNLYSTSSSYGNTRDLLLMSQSSLSAPSRHASKFNLTMFQDYEYRRKENNMKVKHISASQKSKHDKQDYGSYVRQIPSLSNQQVGQQAAASHGDKMIGTCETLLQHTAATEKKTWSSEITRCRAHIEDVKLPTSDIEGRQNYGRILNDSREAAIIACADTESSRNKTDRKRTWSFRSENTEEDDGYYGGNRSVSDSDFESESQEWETVADPSQPNLSYGRVSRSRGAISDGSGIEEHHSNPVINDALGQFRVQSQRLSDDMNSCDLQQPFTEPKNDWEAATHFHDYASLVAEPHDDIEYNNSYSWGMAATHAQTYNNDTNNFVHDSFDCYQDVLGQTQDVISTNNTPPSLNDKSPRSTVDGNDGRVLRRTKKFESVADCSRPIKSSREAVQELHSEDLLVHNCRSTRPLQIFIPPRYKSLKPENLVLETNHATLHNQNSIRAEPSQTWTRPERYLPETPMTSRERRKRASVLSQTKLKSFSLTSRDRLLLKLPVTQKSPNSKSTFNDCGQSMGSPRTFEVAPSLQRNTIASAANTKARRKLKNKLSWVLFGACCLFPPALVCYGVGWMDAVMFGLSHGKIEHVGRTQKRLALVLGSFVCTVGMVIIITAVVILHLSKA